MADYADLEIRLSAHSDNIYGVGLVLRLPDTDAITEPTAGASPLAKFDPGALGAIADDGQAYGRALAAALFAAPEVDRGFTQARAAAAAQKPPVPLRVRLAIEYDARRLHFLRWETLRDPAQPNARLALDANLPFSRYIASRDNQALGSRPPGSRLRALVVIANPAPGLLGLAPVDVPGELQRACEGLSPIADITALCRLDGASLPDPGINVAGPPTLQELLARLRDGCDILYLVGHGQLRKDVPRVFLEDTQGAADDVSGEEEEVAPGQRRSGLVTQIAQAGGPLPRLIVLSSCQSAGTGKAWASTDDGALAALGPRLAEAGVPAVLGMQGNVSMETMRLFTPVFLAELARSGQIDQAAAAGRAAIQARPDWWMPVLYTRLITGQIFAGEQLRLPFTVEPLPDDFVPRSDLADEVISRLVGPHGEAQPGIVALHGFGGFGKTTLAKAVCYDERVLAAYRDGVLWVSLGQKRGEQDLTNRVGDLVEVLTGQRPGFATLEPMTAALERALSDRRCLLVIDDVWSGPNVTPFLRGGPHCARLITTRDVSTLPPAAQRVDVGAMRLREATALLAANLPPGEEGSLRDLAERLGEWPILLRLVNAALHERLNRPNQGLAAAVAYARDGLKRGLTFFDNRNVDIHDPRERDLAVAATVGVSLELLQPDEQARFAELAIFPEDRAVPLAVIGQLWAATGRLNDFDTEKLCDDLAKLSLLVTGAGPGGEATARLHDVMRTYLLGRLKDPAAHLTDLATLHLTLLAVWGLPWLPPPANQLAAVVVPAPGDVYAWRWAAYHLTEAAAASQATAVRTALVEKLVRLVTDDGFQEGHLRLVQDVPALQGDLERALRAAAENPDQAGLPWLVRAGLALVRFRRERLRASPLFELARQGQVDAARRRAALFDVDSGWQQAILLAIAWLAAPANPAAALELRDQVAADLQDEELLRILLQWTDTDLKPGQAPPSFPVTKRPTADDIQALLNRVGAADVDPSYRKPVTGLEEGLSDTGFLAEEDGPELVGYADADDHRAEAKAALDAYVSVFSNYSYPEYRYKSLWILLRFMLQHRDKQWVQPAMQTVMTAALDGSSIEFEQGLPATVIALQARAGVAGARERLVQVASDALAAGHAILATSSSDQLLAPPSSYGPAMRPTSNTAPSDQWGSVKRLLMAVAQAAGQLLPPGFNPDPGTLLAVAANLRRSGFSGYQAAACLALADTGRVCLPADDPFRQQALVAAESAAQNVQDGPFCMRMTARVEAMRRRWWQPFDLLAAFDDLGRRPLPPSCTPIHIVRRQYNLRQPPPNSMQIEYGMLIADTLPELSRLFSRPLADLEGLNPAFAGGLPIPAGTDVFLPDPGFATYIASRLAAEALVSPVLSPAQRVDWIRGLVPVAALSPTALDSVLARLVIAWAESQPAPDPALVAQLAEAAPLGDSAPPAAPPNALIA